MMAYINFIFGCALVLINFQEITGVKYPICEEPSEFMWKTGEWGPCESRDGCGFGHRQRNVTCTDTEFRLQHDSRCTDLVKPSTLEDCFINCKKLAKRLRWVVGRWSACIPTKPSPMSCRAAIAGIAERDVHCLFDDPHGSTKKVDDSACREYRKQPDSVQSCSYDCPQDCVVADFQLSPHHTCGNDSICELEQEPRFFQKVIVAPSNGGKNCPRLQEASEYCGDAECEPDSKGGTEIYVLKVGKWGPCVPFYDQKILKKEFLEIGLIPRIGITRRNLTCLNSRAETVDISLCRPLQSFVTEQKCLVPRDCELSPWTEWKILQEGCINSEGNIRPEIRERRRHVVFPGLGNGKPCGRLYERREVTGDLPSCSKFRWQPLEWGECVVYTHGTGNEVIVHHPTCGGGVHSRNITCLRVTDMVPVRSSNCLDPRPPVVERCEIPCVRDCQVSQWSRWSHCMPGANSTDMTEPLETGYRKRTRSILVSPAAGGKPCPHLEEADTCWEAELSEWRYGNWSECVLEKPTAKCGVGAMTRDYTCVNWRGEKLGEFFCRLHVPPMLTVQECRIPCPNDCMYSEWSQWSECSKPCSTGKRDGVMTRRRDVMAIQGRGGRACSGGHTQKEFCNWHSCDLFRWTTQAWGECEVEDTGRGCGDGLQKREVLCTRGNNTHKDPNMCEYLEKPPDVQRCHVPCAQDCTMTEFSEWSYCPPGCPPDSFQKRQRYILLSAKNGGKPCPEHREEKRPCVKGDANMCPPQRSNRRSNYRWVSNRWGECIMPSASNSCGIGFHVRNTTCTDMQGRESEIHNCMSDDLDLLDFSAASARLPIVFQKCQISCGDGKPSCSLSTWSEWSHCRHKYRAKRYRTRELIGPSYRNQACKARFNLIHEEKCPYIPHLPNAQAPWTACVLETNTATSTAVNNRIIHHSCGSGYQYRAALLLEGLTEVEPGLERDLCLVECPVDCVMGQWSQWSDCNVPCGVGYRKRRRTVLVHANEAGRPCPSDMVNGSETQKEICGVPCSEYVWKTDIWTSCSLESVPALRRECGFGTQTRTVQCVEKRTERKVDARHCDPIRKPDAVTTCTVYCPEDCVVSEWTVWKSCSEPCKPGDHQEQRRRVLRDAGPEGKPCPELVRKEPCVLNRTCFQHKWEVHDWGSCVLPEGAICGEGVQKRALMCLRSDSRHVDAKECGQETPYLKHPMSKPCYVDCPIDCEVSQWTSWNRENCTVCGTSSLMKRTRQVLQQPSAAGQPCPRELEQFKSCPYRPCFHWNISSWSDCDLEGADCGHGVRRRLVRCFRYDGMQTDKIHCLVANLTFKPQAYLDPKWLSLGLEKAEEEECYIPCPGDCVVSEWSGWSHCHKDCAGGQKIGYQTSSRVILKPKSFRNSECPHELWRTKPCWDHGCVDFSWKYNSNNSLVCERADGLIVQGACVETPRPCSPECESQLNGRCDTSKGLCYCVRPDGRRYPVKDEHSSRKCQTVRPPKIEMLPKNPGNLTGTTQEIQLKYYPDDNQVSIWMYAMISIGTAFVVFVAATMYLMCRSSIRRRMTSVHRQGSVRRRCLQSPKEMTEPNAFT